MESNGTDLVQIMVALVALTAILYWALFSGRTDKDNLPKGFFLWGSSASGSLIGWSYAASMISAFVFIGLPGLFYTHGIGGWLYICLPVIFGVSAFYWFGRRLKRLAEREDALSPFEAISGAYNSSRLGAVCLLVTLIFVVPIISVQIVGFGRLLEGYGVDYRVSILGLMSLFVFYAAFAGMRGDIRTDLLQAGVMLVGLFFVAYVAIDAFLSSPQNDLSSLGDSELLTVGGPNDFFTAPRLISLWILMASLPIVHGHYAMRFMVARTERQVTLAMRTAPVLILLIYLPAALIGVIGSRIRPGLESGDQLVGSLLAGLDVGLFGSLMGGLTLAAITSASLSSVDSQFLALGSGVARDVIRGAMRIEISERQEVWIARGTMVLVGFCAIVLALDPPRLVIQLAVFAASGTLTLAPTFCGAVLLRRVPHTAVAHLSILFGLGTFVWAVLWRGLEGFGGWHPGIIALLVSASIYLVGMLVDLRRKP